MSDAPETNRVTRRSEHRQRGKIVPTRFLPEEHAELEARAAEVGLSSSAYLRSCALGDAGPRARRSPTLDRELAARAIAELNKAGSNLNQIARAVNMKEWPGTSSMMEAADAVTRAANQVLQAFGYKLHDRERESA